MKAVTASERVFHKSSSTKVTPKVDIRDDKVLGFVSHTRRARAFVSLSLLLQGVETQRSCCRGGEIVESAFFVT